MCHQITGHASMTCRHAFSTVLVGLHRTLSISMLGAKSFLISVHGSWLQLRFFSERAAPAVVSLEPQTSSYDVLLQLLRSQAPFCVCPGQKAVSDLWVVLLFIASLLIN